MTDSQRTAAGIASVVLILAGLTTVGYVIWKREESTTTWPLPFPQSATEAASTLTQIDVDWWTGAAAVRSPTYTAQMTALKNEAAAIRQAFPNNGTPANGYSCTQLVSMGKLSSTICNAAQANGWGINS